MSMAMANASKEPPKIKPRQPAGLYYYLFLNSVETETHRLKFVVEDGVLLTSLALQGSLFRSDLLGVVERVLIIHAVVAERDGLGGALALDAEEVQCDGLLLL